MYSNVPPPEGDQGENDSSIPPKNNLETDLKPKGVSQSAWEKFQSLQKKRIQITNKSTQRRIRDIKTQVINKVKEEFTTEEDLQILKDNSVSLGVSKGKRKHSPSKNSPSVNKEEVANWQSIQSHLGAHDHLKGIDRGSYAPKTKLEERVDTAISLGDFDTAEKLSDKLATREAGKRIADALDAREFSAKRKKEEQIIKDKKKKKLSWGFEHKEKWEMKANM